MILVVHPDKNLRHFLVSMVKDRLDQPVFGADSGKEMIWHLKKIFFELILISPDLEDASGLDLIKKMRKTHNRFDLPIILIAGQGDGDVIAAGYEAGINDCITVPLNPVASLARIKGQLAMKKEHRQILASMDTRPTVSFKAKEGTTLANPAKDGPIHPPADTESAPVEKVLKSPEPPVQASPVKEVKVAATKPALVKEKDVEPVTATIDAGMDNLTRDGIDPNFEDNDQVETLFHSKDKDQPIPCEMPVSLFIGNLSFFCKTLWITQHDMLLLTFEKISKEENYQLQLLDPKGGTIDLTVAETQRQELQDRGAGVMKLNLKIISAPKSYDTMYKSFMEAFETDGIAGLKMVLRGEEADPATDEQENANMTVAFSSAASSLNVIKGTRYSFIKQVGRGGFASVFLVEDKALKRKVAMKVLNHDFSRVESARYNFLVEAQIAAQFHHPNIVFVYEVGELFSRQYKQFLDFPSNILELHPERLIYFTMQFVEGETLNHWIREKKNESEADCLHILTEVAKALSYAHEKDVVHKDIKPDNIMITPDNHILVMDFGIASKASELLATPDKDGKVEIACTPKYASPEQLRGKPLDGRSDLYSFGVLAYETLTGTTPFRGRSVSELVGKQLKAVPPPLNKRRPNVSPALEEIVIKCLEKRPEARFQDADELLLQLNGLQGNSANSSASSGATLEELLNQAIMIKNAADGARILEQLTAFLQLHKTYDNVGRIRELKQRLTEASLLNLLIEHNLNNDNQQLLYEFFMALDSSAAVMKILHWFRKEKEPWKKLVLGELAVLSAGRDLAPLAVFGLELPDEEASILLKGFGEIAPQCQDPIFLKWVRHSGLKTQRELLKIISIANRPGEEVSQILDYFANAGGSIHLEIRQMAQRLKKEKVGANWS